jgi:hypothetical protein
MTSLVRIYDTQGKRHYLVEGGERVYTHREGDDLLRKDTPADAPLHPAAELREAAKFFDEYFLAPFSGITTNDGRFVSRGRLNSREARQFTAGEGIRGRRPALAEHLDFFDQSPADGMITLRENFTGWRALGFGFFRAALQAALSSVFFGRLADGFAIDIDRISDKRKRGATGIYDATGEVDPQRMQLFLDAFDRASKEARTLAISQDSARAIIDGHASLGMVSSGQFRSLFEVCERLNNGKTITREQFQMLFEGVLLLYAASYPRRDGHAGIQAFGR